LKSGIYKIENIINLKCYLGSSVDIKRRWRQHLGNLRCDKHTNRHLQSSWNQYGEGNFTFSVLEHCPAEALVSREQFYFNTLHPELNLNPLAATNLGFKHSQETVEKMRVARLGIPLSPEWRAAMSAGMKGVKRQPFTPEHCKAIGDFWRGKKRGPLSAERRAEISAMLTGKKRGPYKPQQVKREPRSPEWCAAISIARKGRKQTPEHIEAAAATRRGKPLSQEHKDAIALGHVLYAAQVKADQMISMFAMGVR
jgi:group I intron endonuclease